LVGVAKSLSVGSGIRNENVLSGLGGVIAAAAGLGALLIVLALLRVALRVTSHAVGQTVRALWQLLFGMVADIRFLNMLAIIFCLLAEQRAGSYWPGLAFIVSLSAFVTAALYIGFFLVTSSGLARSPAASGRLGVAIQNMVHQQRLNIGFLGLIYLSLSFCSLSFSYHLLSHRTSVFAHQFVVPDGAGDYGAFFSYTAQAMADSVPEPIAEHFDWRFSTIDVPRQSTLMWGVVLFFRCCFWGALGALLSALFRPRRVFAEEE